MEKILKLPVSAIWEKYKNGEPIPEHIELCKALERLHPISELDNMAKALFVWKNVYLEHKFGSPLKPEIFYRELFQSDEFKIQDPIDREADRKLEYQKLKGEKNQKYPNIIIKYDPRQTKEKNAKNSYSRTEIVTSDFSGFTKINEKYCGAITSPITYIGKNKTNVNSRVLYGLTIDLDHVFESNLIQVHHMAFVMERNDFWFNVFPPPTYIANSGHGLHLYYKFDKPIKIEKYSVENLNEWKAAITDRVWNGYTSNSNKIQYQPIGQGFRLVGSPTKFGPDFRVTVFKTGEQPVSIEFLNKFLEPKFHLKPKKRLNFEEAKKKYPNWNPDKKDKKLGWTFSENVYKNTIKQISNQIKTVGSRYFAILFLAQTAIKCGISKERLTADALMLQKGLTTLKAEKNDPLHETHPFTEDEVLQAIESGYQIKSIRSRLKPAAKKAQLVFPETLRKGRKQAAHLRIARFIRDDQNPNWRINNGRKEDDEKIKAVLNWRKEHPTSTNKSRCAEDLGISRPTVHKFWNY